MCHNNLMYYNNDLETRFVCVGMSYFVMFCGFTHVFYAEINAVGPQNPRRTLYVF